MKGVVPAVWKEAIIIPVPKKGKDKKNPHSCRPISLLSCVEIAGEDDYDQEKVTSAPVS